MTLTSKRSATSLITTLVLVVLIGLFAYGSGSSGSSGSSSSSSAGSAASSGSTTASGTSATAADGFVECTFDRDVDGDTIIVNLDGQRQRVRLIGIDCPESVAPSETGKVNTEEGIEASDYTKSLLSKGQTLYLAKDTSDTDDYNRLLRYVWIEKPDNTRDAGEVSSKMLNGILVYQGYARSYRYRPDTAYNDIFDDLAADAKAAGRGVSSTF